MQVKFLGYIFTIEKELSQSKLDREIRKLIRQELYINAIRLHRERTGSSLIESKSYVDLLKKEEMNRAIHGLNR